MCILTSSPYLHFPYSSKFLQISVLNLCTYGVLGVKSLFNSKESRPLLARADFGAAAYTVGVNGLKAEALREALNVLPFGLNSWTSAIETSIMLLFMVMSILAPRQSQGAS